MSKFPHHPSKRKIIIITIITVLLASASTVALYIPKTDEPNDARVIDTQAGNTNSVVSSETAAAVTEAQKITTEKGPVAGQAYLDAQIAATDDRQVQSRIYSYKSALAASVGGGSNTTASLEYAYEAERLSPSYGTALTLANYEEFAGNKDTALKYYKLYLERATDLSKQLNPGDYEYYVQYVQDLESSDR